MKLYDCVDPIGTWLYAERYLGVGTRAYSSFSEDLEIAEAFHPQRGAASFTVPTFRLPDSAGSYLQNTLPSALHALYRQEGGFLLPVHPETLAFEGLHERGKLATFAEGPPIEVVPLANARTVFVRAIGGEAVTPHFLKLHYPERLSRFTRRLRRPIIALQLWVAEELFRVGVPFLGEVGGGVFGHDPKEAWGYLIRECRAVGEDAPEFTVPLFALYGGDYRAPEEPSLLEQLVAVSGQSGEAYLAERVIEPMVALWAKALLTTGCAAELHGQNTLFAFSKDGARSKIVYRDCAIYIDPAIREGLALRDLPGLNVISRDIRMPSEQVLSLVYDSFMGHHALTFLARLAEERLGVRRAALHEAAREAFAKATGGRRLLPETIYYYDDKIHANGKWRLVDTGEAPVWR
ncbi:ferric iron reductase [Chondromyces apiculatus]|uniref:Aerobactin siderophore biosynthesis IucA/IucC-like C-terminal domain-containing protein n=1 Tax=Chondromyces apiculatus DSM 436 TaxID=1192034 RepID=A0A017T8J5_9BACT|nr:IucA/IucC family C-terminal-domain containing protein [Chondromyces apiculatus]EYF04936.1 Hypothetical protein CAP_3747 [Chondromyces apiculatus DSM 436]